MKPYISKILEHDGKRHSLPLPSKYRELLECVTALGIKDEDDEDDMKVVGYKALFVPVPRDNEWYYHVERTAAKLSELNEAQVRAIGALCDAFSLRFCDVYDIIEYFDLHVTASTGGFADGQN